MKGIVMNHTWQINNPKNTLIIHADPNDKCLPARGLEAIAAACDWKEEGGFSGHRPPPLFRNSPSLLKIVDKAIRLGYDVIFVNNSDLNICIVLGFCKN